MEALEREDLHRSAWLPWPAGCRVRTEVAPEWVLHPQGVLLALQLGLTTCVQCLFAPFWLLQLWNCVLTLFAC